MFKLLALDALSAMAYSGVGLVLMALGFILVDIVTPGNLRHQIWTDGNRNASILLGSNLLGVGAIVAMAIYTSTGGLLVGLASSFVYGIVGLVIMGVGFVLLDLLTPGKLGQILVNDAPHPAVWVSASMHIAVALIVIAGLS
ncbi:DUF350 domain-containing protein [Stackebrandtia soli]|uniref:DUF350 domain-containing protein n=1 Tax=Stackebrandtia soli TaxID=1892856 RepID=UPI0039EBB42E